MTETPVPKTREEAVTLDERDPLAGARAQFILPADTTYLVGHSLGPASKGAHRALDVAAHQDWARDIVGAWNSAGWIDLAERVGAKIAGLIGAKPNEVIVADSVSVNLFKLLVAALELSDLKRIIVEIEEFPTDQYIAREVCDLTGADFVRVDAGEGLGTLCSGGGGVLLKSAVSYRTGTCADVAQHEALAKTAGGTIVWDLSHATGVVAMELNASGAQFATGCTYKYLNGGPGAPAFVYVSDEVVDEVRSPLPGWMGHAQPFAFSPEYEAASGVARMAAGTPPILSLVALAGALEAFEGVTAAQLQAKARALGEICISQAVQMGLATISPEAGRRGGHVSLVHADGYAVVQALAERGVMGDFRTPDTVRFGFSPLYLGYAEVWDAMDALEAVLRGDAWDQERFKARAKVT